MMTSCNRRKAGKDRKEPMGNGRHVLLPAKEGHGIEASLMLGEDGSHLPTPASSEQACHAKM